MFPMLSWAERSSSAARRPPTWLTPSGRERLLAGTSLEQHAGKLREQQNWMGGSSYNPCSAAFVPPPWERVRDVLEDPWPAEVLSALAAAVRVWIAGMLRSALDAVVHVGDTALPLEDPGAL
jgi:hypothetical protein